MSSATEGEPERKSTEPLHPEDAWSETGTLDLDEPAPEPVPSGSKLADRYTVLDPIGAGGFALVYRARDERLGRTVAVKLLRPVKEGSPEERARFEREMKILASLDHPTVIPIYDAALHEGRPFFAMKLATGPTLRDRLREGALDPAEALKITADLAAGLEHAHSRGILHRDIKPGNVLSDEAGRVLLADFGISRSPGMPTVTAQGRMIGTVQYMAPEALAGDANEQSDVYSLGVVLHEMLFGRRCFPEDNAATLIYRVCNETPPCLIDPPVDVGSGVLRLLRDMLAKNPEQRPDGPREVRARLEHLFGGEAPEPEPTDTAVDGPRVAELDALDGWLEAFARASRVPGGPGDAAIEALTSFIDGGTRIVESQRKLVSGGAPPETILLTVVSLSHIGAELARRVEEIGGSRPGRWAGLMARLRGNVLIPVGALIEELQTRAEASQAEDDFFAAGDVLAPEAALSDWEWIEGLFSDDDLRRHETVVRIVGGGLESFALLARRGSVEERQRYLWALWNHADVVMLEGRARLRLFLELVLELADHAGITERWNQLYDAFRKMDGEYAPVIEIQAVLEGHFDMDRKVMAKCLLLHPVPEYRRTAMEYLEPNDLWQYVAHPTARVETLLELWRHVQPSVSSDFMKVFFVCIHDLLLRALDTDRIVHGIELVKECYAVDAFHEDLFFRRLVRLDEKVREASARQHLRVDLDTEYRERFTEFNDKGSWPDRGVDGWHAVPLPIQRRIARMGLFLAYFCAHPVNAIAMECLPHLLAMEEITTYLEIRSINTRLLETLAKEKRFFRREAARYALVANPKTPAHIVSHFVRGLRKDYLRKLAQSRDCNSSARTYAQRLLGLKSR